MIEQAAVASYVVGTAGHIDHGKSTLVKALTGIDPDRLEEEKRRGMTIDLGFAYLDLPSGRHVGIVDVPGHQRFVKNMLAGVHGIDAVIFVIAADEGPMPQTREHLAIVDLLGVEHGLIALTKIDLVDDEWLQLVREDIEAVLLSTSLAHHPIVPVSSPTGRGLDALRAALDEELAGTSPRPDLGRPRLPVDRSFAMPGFGTVVTGTLTGGRLHVGDELLVLPAQRRVRIRGLQQHNQALQEARPGSRTAVNLVGVERREVKRGDVLALDGQLTLTRRLDARVSVLRGAPHPLRHRDRLMLYHGTAELPVEILLLEADELLPGAGGWVQIYSNEPLVALPGDRFIFRLATPPATVAGGIIVDISPRRHRRKDAAVLTALASRETQDAPASVVLEVAKHPFGLKRSDLARRLAMAPGQIGETVDRLGRDGALHIVGDLVLSREAWIALVARLTRVLSAFHRAHPLRGGMSREELKSRTGIPPSLFPDVLARLLAEGALADRSGEVSLPDHQPRLSPEQQSAVDAALSDLRTAHFSPPSLSDWVERHGLSSALVQYLVATDRIVRVNDDTVFERAAYEEAVTRIRTHVLLNQKITVAEARDLLQSSRRYVLPLLEWLDGQKITRRVGDDRILR